MKNFTLVTAALLITSSFGAKAQRYLGVSTGNFLPSKTVSLNPALLTSSKIKWSVDIFSFTAGLDQNYGTINTKNIFSSIENSSQIDINSVDKFLTKGNNDKFSIGAGFDVSLLNLYLNVGNKHSIALTNRVRTQINLQDYDATLFNTLLGSNSGATAINVANLRFNTNSWSEFALSYATTIFEDDQSALSVGLTGKYLSGIAYTGINVNKLRGTYYVDTVNNNGYINANDIQIGGSSSVSQNSSLDGSPAEMVKSMFKGGSSGFGADFGISYEFKQDQKSKNKDQNNYKVRVSAAITDLGSINYKKTTNMSANGTGLFLTDSIKDNVENIDDFRGYLQRQGISTTFEDGIGTQKINLPTSIILGVDYNINNKFFVNASYISGFVSKASSFSPRTATQLSITPRFENKLFTVGVPFSYNSYSQSMKAGLGLRIMGLYLGTDDAMAFLTSSQAKGINFYFGAQIYMSKKKEKVKKPE